MLFHQLVQAAGVVVETLPRFLGGGRSTKISSQHMTVDMIEQAQLIFTQINQMEKHIKEPDCKVKCMDFVQHGQHWLWRHKNNGLLWRSCLWLECVHLCGRGPQIPSVLNSGSRGKPLGSQSEKELESIWEVYLIVNVTLSMVVTLLYELVPEREESPFDLWKIIFDHHLWTIVLIWLYCNV